MSAPCLDGPELLVRSQLIWPAGDRPAWSPPSVLQRERPSRQYESGGYGAASHCQCQCVHRITGAVARDGQSPRQGLGRLV